MTSELSDLQDMAPTDDEFRLIHALQIWPRAPWSQLGPILNADPVTLGRRWAKLTARGMAWVTAQPPSTAMARGAIVEVECAAGAIDAVATELSQDHECLAIDITSGGRDLVLTVGCRTAAAFSRYVVSGIAGISEVRTVRTHPVINAITGASQWRLRTLDSEEVDAVEAARNAASARMAATFRRPSTADREVLSILSRDGRASTRKIAEALHIPTRRARDRLAATLAAGGFELRTDMPRWASGFPVCAWYFLRVPAAQSARVGTSLGGLSAVRTVLSVAGPANLLVSVWLRELADVESLETVIEQKLPGVSIVDRCLVLGVRKRMARIFDEDELPGEVVPWDGG